ncbi:reverse transcriptase domain-containing protein [Apilactobacillus quenuiae]|uniref:reverse transcriptase domain-containing protein n=1 Tax=Apilactobacillus quenuiae TaxID=2008377 RepID=UPI0012FFDC0C|nr:reverse transcriptase domain-containing protein [Apilactobacillus quenuiae]
MEDEILYNDVYTLLHGMFATQLPPLIDEILSKDSCMKLYEESKEDKKTIFKYNKNFSGFIDNLSNEVKPPQYIYGNNWAAESIKFFTIKKDDSWRPMAIPNIKHSLMFMKNSILISEFGLNELYSKNERLNGITHNSESPIIGRNGMVSAMIYEENDGDIQGVNDDQAIGYIGYNGTNKFFQESKLQRFKMEKTYPYILEIDLSNFFGNIYTHLLSQISDSNIFSGSNHKKLKIYLQWLDEYNQKINDNHTKGIIQGPISSKISAELLQLSLDEIINNMIDVNSMDITFTRYVDDYRFYARRYSDLDLLKKHLNKLFRNYELLINNSKIKIYKGFELQRQAHLNEYPLIKSLTIGKTIFYFKDYINLREMLSQLINKDDLPTVKSILTLLTKQIITNNIRFNDNELVISFVMFLIKITYVKPILSSKIYMLIKVIADNTYKMKHKIWNLLVEEMPYIEENFSDTDLETWYFYVIANIGDVDETSKAFTKYKGLNKKMSVLVLTAFLKRNSKKTNCRIERLILDILDIGNDIKVQEVSQTKWWLPIAKLWIVSNRNVCKELKQLFVTKNNQVFWQRLGIIEFLLKQS